MAEENNAKKIVALRTFADDVKQAREKGGMPEDTHVRTPNPVPEKPVAPPVPPPPPIKPPVPEETAEKEPAENPPYHFIRASNLDETDDKESQGKPAEETATQPPPKNPKPTHTLDVDTDAFKEEKTSVLSNRDSIFDTEEADTSFGEGSIVLDRKREKFNLFSAIFKALRGWFGEKKEDIIEARKPKYVVEKSGRRKEVIEAAAQQAKQAPTDDHKEVSKRLENVERITDTKELQIKEAKEVPAPSWTYTKEEQEQQNQALEGLESALSKQKDTEEPPQQTAPQPEEKQIQAKVPEDTKEVSDRKQVTVPEPAKAKGSSGYEAYREKYGKSYDPQEEVFDDESLPPPPEKNDTEKPKFNSQDVPDYRLQRVGQPKRQTSEKPPYLIFIAVVFAAVVLGVGVSVWWFTRTPKAETTPVPEATTHIAVSSVGIPLDSGKENFFTTLIQTIETHSQGTYEAHATINGIPAASEDVLASLFTDMPGSMARSITDISFGSYNSEPFIVMTFTAFDTVFSGILEWEDVLSYELDPLFGEAVPTRTIDSRTNNKDIRALVGIADGQDKVIYGFTDKNTLLITTSRNAYTSLAPQVQ